jgi:hypothetical protein
MIVILALYLSTIIENAFLKFLIPFVAILFVASSFMGLVYENRIANQIIQQGYVDQYVGEHGVGNQKTFKQFIQDLRASGFKVNPRMEKILWEEIKKKTGYIPHQTSV